MAPTIIDQKFQEAEFSNIKGLLKDISWISQIKMFGENADCPFEHAKNFQKRKLKKFLGHFSCANTKL